jgi:formylmethanofuran:tetrahydromethanopterin formyltransferase
MAKKSFVRKTQRTIVGAAKSSAARIQKVAVRAATAAATAAAEAAVEAVMRSLSSRESTARGRKTAAKSRCVPQSEKHRARRRERKDFRAWD